jgi:hypothetical protein
MRRIDRGNSKTRMTTSNCSMTLNMSKSKSWNWSHSSGLRFKSGEEMLRLPRESSDLARMNSRISLTSRNRSRLNLSRLSEILL